MKKKRKLAGVRAELAAAREIIERLHATIERRSVANAGHLAAMRTETERITIAQVATWMETLLQVGDHKIPPEVAKQLGSLIRGRSWRGDHDFFRACEQAEVRQPSKESPP